MTPKRDLVLVLAMAIFTEIWLITPVLASYPLYIIPSALLVLVLPGYALLAAIKPGLYRESNMYKGLFSVNLSIIITIVTFLLLNAYPVRIILAIITIVLAIIAIVRRMSIKSPTEDVQPATVEHPVSIVEKEIPDEEIVIKVENVSMEFNLSQEKVDNIKEYVIKLLKRELFYQEFWALKNVSFQVKRGEKLGIIGLNGAGKSTLLKLISGVMKPTEGNIEVHGGVVPLLELGGGFNSNYTGKENIFLRGALLGYSKSFMESKYDEIVEFAELGEFIDVPLKNYSSGMNSRLGFAISTIVQPQILILDEVLAVGDAKFRKKSEERMNSLLNKNTTVLMVSHSMAQIKKICSRGIWLEKGRLIMEGPIEEVCDKYLESVK